MNGTLVAQPSGNDAGYPVALGSMLTIRRGACLVITASWARARRARGSRMGRLELHVACLPGRSKAYGHSDLQFSINVW